MALAYDQPETCFGGTISENYRVLKHKEDELAQLKEQNGGKPISAAARKALKARLAEEDKGGITALKYDMLGGRDIQFLRSSHEM